MNTSGSFKLVVEEDISEPNQKLSLMQILKDPSSLGASGQKLIKFETEKVKNLVLVHKKLVFGNKEC